MSDRTVSTLSHTSNSPDETLRIGMNFAQEHLSAGDVVTLHGNLGAGKTHFTKGIAMAMGCDPAGVTSPTYALVQEYACGGTTIFHIDAYRLQSEDEALQIGLDEILNDTGAVCVIEWAERIPGLLPEQRWEVHIEAETPETRNIHIRKG